MEREAVAIIASALEDNLQTKLDALDTEGSETTPTIRDFRDKFGDDILTPTDWPAVVVGTQDGATGSDEFEWGTKTDMQVPLRVDYYDADPDSATARRNAAYVRRAVKQVLNDITLGQSRNGGVLLNLTDPVAFYVPEFEGLGRAGSVLLFFALMRDQDT